MASIIVKVGYTISMIPIGINHGSAIVIVELFISTVDAENDVAFIFFII